MANRPQQPSPIEAIYSVLALDLRSDLINSVESLARGLELVAAIHPDLPEEFRQQTDGRLREIAEKLRQTLRDPDGFPAAMAELKGAVTVSWTQMERLVRASKKAGKAAGPRRS